MRSLLTGEQLGALDAETAEARIHPLVPGRVGERRGDGRGPCPASRRIPGRHGCAGASGQGQRAEGDSLTRDVVALLNRTFVTPIDRDDIYRLVAAIDDVCDRINDAASRVGQFGVAAIQPVRAAPGRTPRAHDDEARSRGRQPRWLQGQQRPSARAARARRGRRRASREAVATLFSGDVDPVDIIRWKDIHERLEDAVDACENAADVLEAIFVKNR